MQLDENGNSLGAGWEKIFKLNSGGTRQGIVKAKSLRSVRGKKMY